LAESQCVTIVSDNFLARRGTAESRAATRLEIVCKYTKNIPIYCFFFLLDLFFVFLRHMEITSKYESKKYMQ